MTQYVTSEEYRSWGVAIPQSVSDDDLNKWLQLASSKVNALTFNRIRLDKLTEYQLELVKVSTMYEAEYLYTTAQGTGLDSGVSGWSLQDMSVSYQQSSKVRQWLQDNNISKTAHDLLTQSGLMWRGV